MNYKPVLLATLAYTLITFPLAIVWHVVLFKEQYKAFGYFEGEPNFLLGLITIIIQGFGKTPDTLGKPTIPMIGSVIASLMTAIGVLLLFSILDVNDLSNGIVIGLVLGVLIIFPRYCQITCFVVGV